MPGTFTLTEEQATLLLSLEDWPSFHEGGFELPLILEIEKFRPQWLTFGDRGFDLFGICRVWQVLPTRLGLIAANCALRRINDFSSPQVVAAKGASQ